jgi:glycosyltransferase involved in cell wall biosynthesis
MTEPFNGSFAAQQQDASQPMIQTGHPNNSGIQPADKFGIIRNATASASVLARISAGTSNGHANGHANGAAKHRPLRVISVGPCLARGGAEQSLIYLTRFLNPQRVQILKAVVTNPDFIDPAFVADLPIPMEIGQADAVRRAADECDVLLCWGIELDQWLADHRPKLCVFVAHGEGDWTHMLLNNSARAFDHVIAVSHGVERRICNGFPTSVIHNGVDTSRLGRTRPREVVRQAHGFGPEDFVLGFLGRFSGEKRVERIIDAVAQLPSNFQALLVGWGPERPRLMELANERIPGRYAFVSATDYLGDCYAAMDAVCLVSDHEGFALVLLEAMMCERPLIVTPVGSVPEMIEHRVNGIVVDANGASIAAAAQLIHDHPHWARGMAAEGKAFAELHGHALRMARDYEDFFESLWLKKFGALPLAD